jgi:hypothetical protein
MIGRSVAIAAALGASATTAFILPPGVASNPDAPDLTVSLVDPKKSVVTLPCFECAFPAKGAEAEAEEEGDELFWIQGGANSLVMNFTVSEDGKALHLNGEPIYPIFSESESLFDQSPIHVKQVPSNADISDIESGNVRSTDLEVTAYSLAQGQRQELSPNGDVLISIMLEIMGLEHEYMNLDQLEINLLQTGTDELLIMEITTSPAENRLPLSPPPFGPPEDLDFPPPPPFGGPPHHFKHHKECNMLPAPLCKFKNMLEDKIDQAMRHGPGFRKAGCGGRKGKGPDGMKMPGHMRPDFEVPAEQDGDERPKHHHHGRPHHGRPHTHHHGPHGFFRHHFLHAFAKGLVAVLIPVMAGITVGMSVSLLGLIVGRLIGFLWIRLARGGRRGSASAAKEEVIVDDEDEDKAMLAEMEAPPVYEDAPAYVDVVEKQEDEK